MSRKSKLIEAAKPVGSGKELGKDLLKLVGIGLVAGVGLVAATDRVMKKFFSDNRDDEEYIEDSDYDKLDDLD